MKRWVILAALAVFLGSMQAWAGEPTPTGDEDIYPIACVDFSGSWEGDAGPLYQIEQKRCNWLRIHATVDSQDTSTTIVPDNKRRSVSGSKWTGVVRHRWGGTKDFGKMLESYKTMYFADHRVQEVATLEVVNESLLLESIYRTIQPSNGGQPRNEYQQHFFRRVSYARKPR